jgi:phenylacetate-CoA ligase
VSAVAEPFDRLDTLSSAALERWWTRRVRRTLEIADAEVPFYRERFAAAEFAVSSFRSLADLARIPILRKADLLALQLARGSNLLGIERTHGRGATSLSLSSGTSALVGTTFIHHTDRWRRVQGPSSCRAHWWAGLRPGSPLVLSAPAWHSYGAIQPFIADHFGMPCVVVSGTYLPRFAERIIEAYRRFRPRFVNVFLPMVFSLLAEGKRQGLEGRAVFDGVETLAVTGAPISPGVRDHLVAATGVARVAELAGTSESLLAADCAEGKGLHVVPDTCYADVLDRSTSRPVAEGERGTVVHVFLIAEGSMFIRWDAEDVAVIDRSPCPCGLPSPRLKLLGRWENAFSLGGERLVPYDVQLALERAVPELVGGAFAISREALAAGRLRLLLPEPETRATAIADEIRARLGERFAAQVEVAFVRELPLAFKGVAPVLSETQVG